MPSGLDKWFAKSYPLAGGPHRNKVTPDEKCKVKYLVDFSKHYLLRLMWKQRSPLLDSFRFAEEKCQSIKMIKLGILLSACDDQK